MAQVENMRMQAMVNNNFRQVIATGQHIQVVIMSVPPDSDVGEEVHTDSDQILYLVDGAGTAVLDGVASDFNSGDLVFVPAGTMHNFITKDGNAMKIITTYSPPHHPDGDVQATRA
ncbi:MAG: cupin domain-containing protein [Candidatus Saccharimonadales bacterium]